MTYLHITNGDVAGDLISASGLKGEVLPWRDTMHVGPFRAGGSLAQTSAARARFLAGDNLDPAQVQAEFAARDAKLTGFRAFERVVLWFEHDLLDQLQILQILDWFAGQDLGSVGLEMICIDRFDGVPGFRGLGQLKPVQIGSLFAGRAEVEADQLHLARLGWAAFREPDPRALVKFIKGDLTALPFLAHALARHLQEYPWASDGLTRSERQLLTLLKSGPQSATALFLDNMDLEEALFLGDLTTFSVLRGLKDNTPPVLVEASDQTLALSDVGHALLGGKAHGADVIARDVWLGGVHLDSRQGLWVWDDARGDLAWRAA